MHALESNKSRLTYADQQPVLNIGAMTLEGKVVAHFAVGGLRLDLLLFSYLRYAILRSGYFAVRHFAV